MGFLPKNVLHFIIAYFSKKEGDLGNKFSRP